jgi:hypothetical protein
MFSSSIFAQMQACSYQQVSVQPCKQMAAPNRNTEAELRAQMHAILKFGVTKRALANRLNVHESWLNRWLAKKSNVSEMTVPVMDRFRQYVSDFYRTLEETQRATSEPSTTATAGTRFRKHTG